MVAAECRGPVDRSWRSNDDKRLSSLSLNVCDEKETIDVVDCVGGGGGGSRALVGRSRQQRRDRLGDDGQRTRCPDCQDVGRL